MDIARKRFYVIIDRKFVVGILFLFVCIHLCAQRIADVRFEPFGRALRIHYSLSRLPYDAIAVLDLYVSTNGGVSFTGPLVQVQGDIGMVKSNGAKSVVWQAVDEMGALDGQIVFELRGEVVKEKIKVENVLLYNVSGSSGVGLMYGRVARWGGYVRGKTNLSMDDAPYTCDDAGVLNYEEDGSYYVLDKQSRRSRLGFTGGVLYRPLKYIYVYVGAGYGYRRLMWHAKTFAYSDAQQVGEVWTVNTAHSAEGIETELGGFFRYKNWAVSLGVNAVAFSFFEVNGGVGLFF